MAAKRKNISGRLLRIRKTDAVVFGDFVHDPGATLGPRTQQDFQLVFLFSGTMAVRVDRSTVTLQAGEMCVLQPGKREYFAFDAARATHQGWCAARPESLDASLEARLQTAAGAGTTAAVSERTAKLLEIAFSIPEEAAAGLLESLAGAVFEEFLLAAEGGKPDQAKPPLPDAVSRAQKFIEAHYPERLDLSRIARAAGMSTKHLGKIFRRHLGVTPIRHLWRVRTAKGAQLLTETGLSLSEIAERVGFQNAFHFSRLIRQEFGVSPRTLRDERWNSDAARGRIFRT